MFHLDKSTNIDNVNDAICFLSAAQEYNFNSISDKLKQIIIFVPYNQSSLIHKAKAKRLAQKFSGKDIIIFDTNYTYKSAQNCNLYFNEISSTIVMAADFLISQGYAIEIGEYKCLEKENKYLKSLKKNLQKKMDEEEKNVQNVL